MIAKPPGMPDHRREESPSPAQRDSASSRLASSAKSTLLCEAADFSVMPTRPHLPWPRQ